MILHRRSFLKYASLAATGSMAGFSPFGSLAAMAAGPSDYKAMVCVFLYGGNDANNLLVPGSSAAYSNYASLRGSLALKQGSLLPLNGQPSLCLNPNLPRLQAAFNGGSAAFLANVGTLVQPLTAAQYATGSSALPQNLFSHLDQQTLWQNADSVSSNTAGWAGRISDYFGSSASSNLPMVISAAGTQVFCSGRQTQPVTITPGASNSVDCFHTASDCASRQNAAQQFIGFDTGVTLVQADQTITSNAYAYSKTLGAALADAPALATPFPSTPGRLSAQLAQIAKVISVRSALGASRQIFFALLGGFDTHSSETATHNALMSELDVSLSAFSGAMAELGVGNQVTTFTMSDFNRALQPNTAGGSDHAWGSHHLILGGAVNGGKVYGTYPTLALKGPDDVTGMGVWLPTTSNTQYAATLASWFGVPAAALPGILPCAPNFSNLALGFI